MQALPWNGGRLYRTLNGGTSWTDITPPLPGDSLGIGTLVSAVTLDPNNPKRVLVGEHRLWQSLDRGKTWHAISPLLSNPKKGFISAIAVSASAPSTILVGTAVGLRLTKNGGKTWVDLTAAPRYRDGPVAISPANPQVMLVHQDAGGLFRTVNGGRTWSDIGGTPGLPVVGNHIETVLSMAPDWRNSQIVYAGTTSGPFVSVNGRQDVGSTRERLPARRGERDCDRSFRNHGGCRDLWPRGLRALFVTVVGDVGRVPRRAG